MPTVAAKVVQIGSNTFEECDAPLALSGQPLLAFQIADGAKILVTLKVTSPPAVRAAQVVANSTLDPNIEVTADDLGVTVLFKEGVASRTLLKARRMGPEGVYVSWLDLSPLGVAVAADAFALRLGASAVTNCYFARGHFGIHIGGRGA